MRTNNTLIHKIELSRRIFTRTQLPHEIMTLNQQRMEQNKEFLHTEVTREHNQLLNVISNKGDKIEHKQG